MKVLAIMGSPRKGDSYKVTQLFEEQLKSFGEVDFEYLFLKDLNLVQCKGCHLCIMKGEQFCPLNDDRDLIAAKIAEADGIVFVSPVYSQHITAIMKNFIDRFSYCWHRPGYFTKKGMAIASGGGQFKETLGYLKQNAKAWGMQFVTQVGVPHLDALTENFRKRSLRDLNKAAKKFYNALQMKELPKPTLGQLIWFRVWRINAEACKEAIPSDYAFWTEHGLWQSDYYYRSRVNPIKRVIANFIGVMIRLAMKKIYVGY